MRLFYAFFSRLASVLHQINKIFFKMQVFQMIRDIILVILNLPLALLTKDLRMTFSPLLS